jgi:hypothetical protein
LLKKKQSGQKIEAPRQSEPSNVVNLMDALRRSVETERAGSERRNRRELHEIVARRRRPGGRARERRRLASSHHHDPLRIFLGHP